MFSQIFCNLWLAQLFSAVWKCPSSLPPPSPSTHTTKQTKQNKTKSKCRLQASVHRILSLHDFWECCENELEFQFKTCLQLSCCSTEKQRRLLIIFKNYKCRRPTWTDLCKECVAILLLQRHWLIKKSLKAFKFLCHVCLLRQCQVSCHICCGYNHITSLSNIIEQASCSVY